MENPEIKFWDKNFESIKSSNYIVFIVKTKVTIDNKYDMF